MPKIFTGQNVSESEEVPCHVCQKPAHMRSTAWFDPYRGKNGKYVHHDCLSQKRQDEIAAERIEKKIDVLEKLL
jgi:hypothetical protein